MGKLHFAKAPITEAIIDLRVTPRQELTIERIQRMCRSEKSAYPTAGKRFVAQGMMQFGDQISTSSMQEQIGFACTSADGKQVFQARRDGFTLSRLAPYQSWEQFSKEARRLWDVYRKHLRPSAVDRIAVRYINRLDLPGPKPEMKDYFYTFPEVSPQLPQILNSCIMQLVIPQEDMECQLIINEAIVPPISPDVISVVLDIDLFRDRNVPRSETEIWELFERLRERKNYVFTACITERAKELIR